MSKNFFMHTPGNRHSAFFPHRRFLPHKTLPSFLMLLWSLFFAVVGGYYVLQKLRVFAAAPLPPSHVISINDDRSATIKWTASPDSDTVGYKVTWTQNGTSKTLFTPYPDAQLVGLIPGKIYQVYVQSVNKNGDVSTSVGPVIAQSDSRYVTNIKQQMNGLFDDFNDNTYNGLPDPTHWYTTVTNASDASMAFVAGDQNQLQMFVQNDSSNKIKDRASITMRSLVPFDFTNRTGTMAFDFDFGQAATDTQGYQWSLTISPSRVDDITTDAVYNGSQIYYPMDAFQIHMVNDTISFRKISNGVIAGEWDSTYSHTHPLRDIGVLKHAILKLTTDSAQLFVDGIQILSASNMNLGFSKGWVYNQQLAFDLPKEHIPFALSHFDNIGFDAPVGTSAAVIHTYTAGGYGSTDRKTIDFFNNTATYTLSIPDSLSGETAERLFIDTNIQGSATPTITVNQTPVAWPHIPGFDDNGNFNARVISLPAGTLHQGVNTVVISATDKNTFSIAMQNVHAEIEFPQNVTGAYTPYEVPFSGNVVEEKIPSVAPIPSLGAQSLVDGQLVRATVLVEALADGGFSLLPTGHLNPVTELELDVDGVPQTIVTLSNPTTKTDQILSLDTTKIPNGQHTITITAYGEDKNVNGKIASLNSFDTLLQNNPLTNAKQLRRVVIFSNGGPEPSPFPTVVIPQSIVIPTHQLLPTPQASSAVTPLISSGSATLGNTTIGKIHDVNDANHINGIRFSTGDTSVTTAKAHVYVGKVDAASQNAFQMAVYTDNNGKPGTLVASSTIGTLIPFAWNSIPLVASLQPHMSYWLMYNTNASTQLMNNLVYDSSTEASGVSAVYQFGSFPDTLSAESLGNWQFSMYLTLAP